MAVKHAFTSAKADGGDATLVQPSNWNASHNAPPAYINLGSLADTTLTNQSASLAELIANPGTRTYLDFTYADQVRLAVTVRVTGAAGSYVAVQYSTDNGSSWYGFDGVLDSTSPSVSLASGGIIRTAWTSLPAAAKADVLIRVVGGGGDGAADPRLTHIVLGYR